MNRYYSHRAEVLRSSYLTLTYLTGAGPRLVKLARAGVEENVLCETPEIGWETPNGRFNLFGGHRLWAAPETIATTYVPDNEGLQVERLKDGITLTMPAPAVFPLEKQITVRLDEGAPVVRLTHQLINRSEIPIRAAPWAITQLPLGGRAWMPVLQGKVDPDGLQPSRNLVLWPYSRMADERLEARDNGYRIKAEQGDMPLKIGTLSLTGWMVYKHAGVYFFKRFELPHDRLYPDMNVNAEIYVGEAFIELETLGPLVELMPGESTVHEETWEVYGEKELPEKLRDEAALI